MSKKIVTMLALAIVGTMLVVTVVRFLPILKKKVSTSVTTQQTKSSTQTTSGLTPEITSIDQLTSALEGTRPMIFKFYASWCGACTYVNNYYAELKDDLPDFDFYSINIDNQELMQQVESQKLSKEGIVYLPTFLMIQSGKDTKQITGAKKKEDMITEIKKAFSA